MINEFGGHLIGQRLCRIRNASAGFHLPVRLVDVANGLPGGVGLIAEEDCHILSMK